MLHFLSTNLVRSVRLKRVKIKDRKTQEIAKGETRWKCDEHNF